MDKFCYSIDDEYYYGCYDSRIDAIEAAKDDLIASIDDEDLEYNKTFTIKTAKCDFYKPQINKWDVDDVIERINDRVYNYCGVDDYMDDLSKGDVDDLTKTLNEAFQKWVKENYKRECWGAEDIQEHFLTHADLGVEKTTALLNKGDK